MEHYEMDYPDSSPERRNLILISLAFILFFAADGSLNGESVRFSLVNITFNRPEIIQQAAWVYLVWSLIRFCQKHGFMFWKKLRSDMLKLPLPKSMQQYAIDNAVQYRQDKHSLHVEIGKVEIVNSSIEEGHFSIVCNLYNKSDALISHARVPMHRVSDKFYFLGYAIKHSMLGNSFSEELLPYILFSGAILSALLN